MKNRSDFQFSDRMISTTMMYTGKCIRNHFMIQDINLRIKNLIPIMIIFTFS